VEERKLDGRGRGGRMERKGRGMGNEGTGGQGRERVAGESRKWVVKLGWQRRERKCANTIGTMLFL